MDIMYQCFSLMLLPFSCLLLGEMEYFWVLVFLLLVCIFLAPTVKTLENSKTETVVQLIACYDKELFTGNKLGVGSSYTFFFVREA